MQSPSQTQMNKQSHRVSPPNIDRENNKTKIHAHQQHAFAQNNQMRRENFTRTVSYKSESMRVDKKGFRHKVNHIRQKLTGKQNLYYHLFFDQCWIFSVFDFYSLFLILSSFKI